MVTASAQDAFSRRGAQQCPHEGDRERAHQDQEHLAVATVERGHDQAGERDEADHVDGPDPAHHRVQLVQGRHAEHDQPEGEDQPPGDDDEQREDDRRDRVEHPRRGVRAAAAFLLAGGHLSGPRTGAPARRTRRVQRRRRRA